MLQSVLYTKFGLTFCIHTIDNLGAFVWPLELSYFSGRKIMMLELTKLDEARRYTQSDSELGANHKQYYENA